MLRDTDKRQVEKRAPDKRQFTAGVSVRLGPDRVRLELCPAPVYGGPQGFFRARIGRRWIGGGEPVFFDQPRLAALLAKMLFDGFEEAAGGANAEAPAAPDLPRNSRVSVRFWHKGAPHCEGLRTATPPIRAYDGHYYVGVVTFIAGFLFVPLGDCTLREGGKA